MNLTANEIAALELTLNYNDREVQKSDNYSNAGIEEFASEIFEGNLHAAAGLVSSLEKKGLGVNEDDDELFWLSDAGIDAIFDVIELRDKKVETIEVKSAIETEVKRFCNVIDVNWNLALINDDVKGWSDMMTKIESYREMYRAMGGRDNEVLDDMRTLWLIALERLTLPAKEAQKEIAKP